MNLFEHIADFWDFVLTSTDDAIHHYLPSAPDFNYQFFLPILVGLTVAWMSLGFR